MCRQLYRESGGNPFFLLQLARAETLADRGPAASGDDASSIPEPVRAALGSQLSSLSAPALVLLQTAKFAFRDPIVRATGASLVDPWTRARRGKPYARCPVTSASSPSSSGSSGVWRGSSPRSGVPNRTAPASLVAGGEDRVSGHAGVPLSRT